MKKINLREYYPHYKYDAFIELSDDIVAELDQYRREEDNHARTKRRKKVYSLDRNDGLADQIPVSSDSACEEFIRGLTRTALHAAILSLPEKQTRRIYAHYFCRRSIADIARYEGVHPSSVRESITCGRKTIKKILTEHTENPFFWQDFYPDK
jgi:RNA polymerase sigma-70 factor (ECF subfamily)